MAGQTTQAARMVWPFYTHIARQKGKGDIMSKFMQSLFTDLFKQAETAEKASKKGGKRKDEYEIAPAADGLTLKDTAARIMRCEKAHKQTRMLASLVWAVKVLESFRETAEGEISEANKALEAALAELDGLNAKKKLSKADSERKTELEISLCSLYVTRLRARLYATSTSLNRMAALCQIKTNDVKFGEEATYDQYREAADELTCENIQALAAHYDTTIEATCNALAGKLQAVLIQIFPKPVVREVLFGQANDIQMVKVATMLAELRVPACHLNANVRAKVFSKEGIKFGQIYTPAALIEACLKVAGQLRHEFEELDIKVAGNWNRYVSQIVKETPAKSETPEIGSEIDNVL